MHSPSLVLITRSIWRLVSHCWYLGDGYFVHILQVVPLGPQGVSLRGTDHLLRSAETISGPRQSGISLLCFQHSDDLISGQE